MPKTGTSSLQHALFEGLKESKNAYYANLPTPNHSAQIFSLFHSHPEIHNVNLGRSEHEIKQYNKNNLKLLINGFLRDGRDIEIISGEDIFHIDEQGLLDLKEFLQTYFAKVVIVGYVRFLKSFMESSFQQLVKYHFLNTMDESRIYPFYKNKLEKFDNIFGKENVQLSVYEPKRFPNEDITLDFCERFNIDIEHNKKVVTNQSISKEAISILYTYNKRFLDLEINKADLMAVNRLVDIVSPIGDTRFRFSKSYIDKVVRKRRDDIKWIENRLREKIDDENSEIGIESEEELLSISSDTISELKRHIIDKIELDDEEIKKIENSEDLESILDLVTHRL
jgi:hypothetical protein